MHAPFHCPKIFALCCSSRPQTSALRSEFTDAQVIPLQLLSGDLFWIHFPPLRVISGGRRYCSFIAAMILESSGGVRMIVFGGRNFKVPFRSFSNVSTEPRAEQLSINSSQAGRPSDQFSRRNPKAMRRKLKIWSIPLAYFCIRGLSPLRLLCWKTWEILQSQ